MRTAFEFSKTNVSMRKAELTDADLGIAGPKTGRVVATEWQVVYTRADGSQKVHLAYRSESECDAAMDAIQAEAIAYESNN